MWSIEDIEALNPAEPTQSTSFLQHVLHIGAASVETLCNAALLLEKQGTPHVIGFAQLPFVVRCGDSFFRVRGWREGVTVEISFTPIPVAFSQTGQLKHLSSRVSGAQSESDGREIWFTQVTAVVRLWNTRAKLHKAYLNCISHTGLRNEVIGRVENWMDMPEAQLSLPARRYAPLTAQAFQVEVARRVRTEIHSAIRKFMRAYCVANLEELPDVSDLYGYFVMVAPGRLACASPPIPIAAGLCIKSNDAGVSVVDVDRIANLLDKTTTLGDRVLGQLMAMNRLLHQGEFELALIGCVTAIEWFLNDRFAERVQRSRSGRQNSASISACLRSGALEFLDENMKACLLELSLARNAMVHGPPPARSPGLTKRTRHSFAVNKEFVLQGLFLALALYRAVNIKFQESQDGAAQQTAPEFHVRTNRRSHENL